MVRHNRTRDIVSYDQLYDSLVQFEPHVQASKAKRASRNHDPLALIAHSNASSSLSYANPSYSHSPQSYYVTHPSLVVDYEEYSQGDSQKDKLITAMINQAVIQDGRVDIQTRNAGYGANGHYARDCPKPRVRDAKYFREQILLAMKDEARRNLNDKENDFMLDNSFGDDTLEELTVAVIMMAQIQPADDNGVQKPNYDAKAVSEINASHKMISKRVHEHKNHGKYEHDSTALDQYHDVKILAYNALQEATIKND
ncbi:hypothetical protein Tco_1454364 [Tanacetum coccineum]